MNLLAKILLCILAGMSFVTFIIYGLDKLKAKLGKWRISEKTLLLCALCMGGPGALLGMYLFRHKTKHVQFKILVPLCCIINIAVILAAVRWA